MTRNPLTPAALGLSLAATLVLSGAAAESRPAPAEPRVGGGLELESPLVVRRRPGPQARNAALFVRQTPPPETMKAGESARVSVTMRNLGGTTWTAGAGYRLGSQNPRDNVQWGDGRVMLSRDVRPQEEATFEFTVTAPAEPGTHHFQWRMLREHVEWFGGSSPDVAVKVEAQPTPGPTPGPAPARRTGRVRLDQWTAVDDQGPFNAVGFTLMSGLRLYRSNREQLNADLTRAHAAGYHFARVLAEVDSAEFESGSGRPCQPNEGCNRGYWYGYGVDPRWSDYDQVFTGYLEYAFARGIRTEVTIFGGSPWSMHEAGSRQNRRRFVERLIGLMRPHLDKVMYVEIVNEPGVFGKIDDVAEMAEYARLVRDALPGVIVAMGAPMSVGLEQGYADKGFPMTYHLDRDISKADGVWRPVRQPWEAPGFGKPWSNNEPSGPGSSVSTDDSCERLKAHALTTFISKGFAFVYHSAAGVRSTPDRGYSSGLVSDMPCFADVPLAAALLPPGQPNFARQNGHWPDSPFRNLDDYIEGGNTSRRGTMRIYSGTQGGDLSTVLLHVPVGIKLECRNTGPVTVYKLQPLGPEQVVDCAPGRNIELGPGARLLRRGQPGSTPPAPGPTPTPAPTPTPTPTPGPTPAPVPPGPWNGRIPDFSGVVNDVARRNPEALRRSCQDEPGGNWQFLDLLVAELRARDGRFGYNCKRGNCGDPSKDGVAYYAGSGEPRDGQGPIVWIDTIAGHCGSNPQPSWQVFSPDPGNGRWLSRRP